MSKTIIQELLKPTEFKYIGAEKEFEDYLYESIEEFNVFCPDAVVVGDWGMDLRVNGYILMMTIYAKHLDVHDYPILAIKHQGH